MRARLTIALLSIGLALSCAAEQDAVGWYGEARGLVDAAPEGHSLRHLPAAERATVAQYLQRALSLDSTLVEARLLLAQTHMADGHYEAATRHYRHLIEANPELAAAYQGLGLSLAAQGRYSAALRAYQDALRQGALSAGLYTLLGNAYQALGHIPAHLRSAAATYQAALQLDPGHADTRLQLARVEERLGNTTAAAAQYRQAHQLAPEDLGIRLSLAAFLQSQDQSREAEDLLRAALADQPEHALLQLEMGRLLWQGGQTAAALVHFQNAVQADSTLSPAYRYLGLALSAQGRTQEALAVFLQLENLRPLDPSAKVSSGIVYTQQGDLERAEARFQAAMELGDDGDAALKLGGLYMHQARFQAAIRVFKKALTEHPEHAELHASLGDAYRRLGMIGTALAACRQAVRLEPERALWHFHLASTLDRLDAEQARLAWRRYMELAADDPGESARLAQVRARLADSESNP